MAKLIEIITGTSVLFPCVCTFYESVVDLCLAVGESGLLWNAEIMFFNSVSVPNSWPFFGLSILGALTFTDMTELFQITRLKNMYLFAVSNFIKLFYTLYFTSLLELSIQRCLLPLFS